MKRLVLCVLALALLLTACANPGNTSSQPAGSSDETMNLEDFLTAVKEDPSRFWIRDGVPYGYIVRDLDGNGVDECVMLNGTNFFIFTLESPVRHVSDYAFSTATTRWFTSDNAKFPGIFFLDIGGGKRNYAYLSLNNGKIEAETLYTEDYLNDDALEVLSTDKDLVAEAKKAFADANEVSFIPMGKITDNIGRKLKHLRKENPTYEYVTVGGPDCFYTGLGKADKSFAYIFFGGQDGPTIADVAEKNAELMGCAGIYTTVGEIFADQAKLPLSVDDLLAALEVTEADYWDGWIIFLYNGKAVEIETGSGDPDNVDAKPTVKITADMPCIVADRMSLEVNGNIVHYN